MVKITYVDGKTVISAKNLNDMQDVIIALEEFVARAGEITNGKDGVGIKSIEQTTTSSEDGGTNVITVTLTDGSKSTFTVKNGSAGSGSGGSGSGEDGVGIASISYKGVDSNGGNVYTVSLTDGSTYEITAPKGDAGDQGEQGPQGVQGERGNTGANGYTPVRGTDYWTAVDIAEIKSYVDEAILGGAW